MKEKILVTGTAGFIGFHLAKRLLEDGYEVVGLDNINDYYDVNLKYTRLSETGINHVQGSMDPSTSLRTGKVQSSKYPKSETHPRRDEVESHPFFKFMFTKNSKNFHLCIQVTLGLP